MYRIRTAVLLKVRRALFSRSRLGCRLLACCNLTKPVRWAADHFLFCKRAELMTQKREEVASAVSPFELVSFRGLGGLGSTRARILISRFSDGQGYRIHEQRVSTGKHRLRVLA